MKKLIIAGIAVIACVALCAAVWPRSAEVGVLPAEPVKIAVSAEIEARSEQTSHIFISAVTPASEVELVSEGALKETEVTAEEKTETTPPAATTFQAESKPETTSNEPKLGDRTVINGEPHIWIPGFGWIVDECGGSIGTMVGNPGDPLTGHKVGVMGGRGTASSSTSSPAYTEPEITGDVLYTELQPPVTKDSTPPAYKPNGEPYTP